jgi:hypothetical protein
MDDSSRVFRDWEAKSMIYVLSVGVVVLLVLVIRFLQPEFIYSLRYYLTRVQCAKTFLESQTTDEDRTSAFARLLVNDCRFEVLGYDDRYVLERATKLRKLSHVLDLRRGKIPGLPDKRKPQVCIIELANLLGNLARAMIPDKRYDYIPVDAHEILVFIGDRIRTSKGIQQPLASERHVADWFTESPTTIEQTIELLIASVHLLAYRQRAQTKEPLGDEPNLKEVQHSLQNTQQTLLELVYLGCIRKYHSMTAIYERIRTIIGDERYARYSSPSLPDRSLLDELELHDLELFVLNEWEIFGQVFINKEWLKERFDYLTRFVITQSPEVSPPRSDLILAIDYCRDIDRRITFFKRREQRGDSPKR